MLHSCGLKFVVGHFLVDGNWQTVAMVSLISKSFPAFLFARQCLVASNSIP